MCVGLLVSSNVESEKFLQLIFTLHKNRNSENKMKLSIILIISSACVLSIASRNVTEVVLQESKQQMDSPKWHASFTPNKIEINMNTAAQVELIISDIDTKLKNYIFRVQSTNPKLVAIQREIHSDEVNQQTSQWIGNVSVNGLFLGQAQGYVELIKKDSVANEETQRTDPDQMLTVTVLREVRIIDHVFTVSVALLVSLLYINFGAALDLTVLQGMISYPIGPAICFTTQFLLMPILGFGLGYILFPDSVEMQLGLFFTGVSPGGGASNIWAVLLGGNINLSVLMTTISNFAAFGSMPLWIFTLGRVIFERGNLGVPYGKIATFAVSLVVPLAIGVTIQRCSPRLTRILVRLLKPISTALILFIIIFAIVTNLYLFELFSWKIIVGGLALPWLGYIIAFYVAKIFRQNPVDALTIAIETGIQNTGIAIFLLRFSLPQPQADLTTVIPVAVAIMTPFPLLALYLIKKCAARQEKNAENQRII